MKNILAVIFAVCLALLFVCSSEAVPAFGVEEIPEIDVFAADAEGATDVYIPGRGDRHRRVTCDLLSISLPWGSMGHGACSAHCLALMEGYSGGRCVDGICKCRR